MAERISVPVHLTREQILALRDLVVHSDMENPIRNDTINELAAGLLRFGSSVWEIKSKCADAENHIARSCRNCRHVCFDDNGNHKDDPNGCPRWVAKDV